MTYRADIDGLRAIAVAGVVLFHAKLGVPGGYAGVDVFFVISGFLITGLIMRDLRAGNFSLMDFWERRARRILPALAVVVAFTLAAGWFVLLPDDYAQLGERVAALLGFAANIKFWLESGYFAPEAEVNPLLHTWTLSLEEQYYVLIPLFLGLLFRLRRSRWVVPLLWLGAAASFAAAVYGTRQMSSGAFYLLPTRAWELAAGSLLAFAGPISRLPVRATLGWLGLAAIVASFFAYDEMTRFPGIPALAPVLGAVLLIWSGMRQPGDPLPSPHRLLATRPLIALGLISYSFYLWHWPLLAGYRYAAYGPLPLGMRLAMVSAALVLACLSWRFVEQPFRKRGLVRTRSAAFRLSAATIALLLIASATLWGFHGFKSRLTPLASLFEASKHDAMYRFSHDLADVPNNLVHVGATTTTAPGVFLWGDSHAAAALPGLDLACQNAGLPLTASFTAATAPVLGWFRSGDFGIGPDALPMADAVLAHISSEAAAGRLTTVVLAARWSFYLTDQRSGDSFPAAFARTLEALQRCGCKVVILQETPCFSSSVPSLLALHCPTLNDIPRFALPAAHYDLWVRRQRLLFAQHPSIPVVIPTTPFTDSKGRILPADSHGTFFRDSNHFTLHGSRKLASGFSAALLR
jgi:peptidoglycan/LPS O-acetylase OafA/YrhL